MENRLPKVIGWTKYSNNLKEYSGNATLAVMNEIFNKGFKFGGNYHQYGEYGCPVMEDKSVALFSMRAWGDLIANIYGGCYCDYAWEDNLGKVPSKEDYIQAIDKT